MRARRPAWAGRGTPVANALLVGVGLGVVGVASFASLALAARSLDEGEFAHFATWLTTANLMGLAFAVVESYLPRLMVAAQGRSGAPDRDIVATFARGIAVSVAAIGCVVLGGARLVADHLFNGNPVLVALLVAYLVPMAAQSHQRAVAIGRDRFVVFPAQMGVDGLGRMLGASLATAMGARSATTFAALMCLGAALGVVSGWVAHPTWFAWRRPLSRTPLTPLFLLLAGSVSPLVINNAGVIWISARGAPAVVVGAVAGALTLSRLPTLMVGSAYGPILTPLARAVEARRLPDFRRAHRRALGLALLLAVGFVVVFVAAGPELLSLYLGGRYRLGRGELAAMAAGSGLMFACVVEQAALVAMAAWHRVALGWFLALVAFGAALTAPLDPPAAVALAVLLGPLLAVTAMGASRAMLERPVFARPAA